MTGKKPLVVTLIFVVLGGFWIYLNRDWFVKDTIEISHRVGARGPVAGRRGAGGGGTGPIPVFFNLNKKYQLTSVRVIPVSDILTNKYPHPIWELVAQSNSVPTREFAYGETIRGMQPRVPGARPDPLGPGVKYRLFVETALLKVEHDFSTPPTNAAGK